ncbi:MAG: hypothetical protein EBR82_53440 [Caulobacteraceae bacterium]|nr:hypothetical protein [Caulobacteraceae bacterium]
MPRLARDLRHRHGENANTRSRIHATAAQPKPVGASLPALLVAALQLLRRSTLCL